MQTVDAIHGPAKGFILFTNKKGRRRLLASKHTVNVNNDITSQGTMDGAPYVQNSENYLCFDYVGDQSST